MTSTSATTNASWLSFMNCNRSLFRFALPALLSISALPFVGVSFSATQRTGVHGLKGKVEVLRDRWGVPHIYASNTPDLFFAQGFVTAQDRLFQLDLWRRVGTGKLAEVLGPKYVQRDRMARLVRFRGDWNAEWQSYAPDAKQIATSFTAGINEYIRSLHGQRPVEFHIAGYDPGFWAPEDVTARVAGLLMTGNLLGEVSRTLDVQQIGLEADARLFPPEPAIPLLLPEGLDLRSITPAVVHDYLAAISAVRFPGEQGSNNWVVDGSMTRSGRPLLANDPHRPVELPSLRKTVHLVAPGWNVIGAGEPALPGIALGHNEDVAWGFTIVGIDQQDLYVEKMDPADPHFYATKNGRRAFDVEQTPINVKGQGKQNLQLKYSIHGPVIYEDSAKHLAYALHWVGTQAGGAGYLPALKLARAHDWATFRKATASYLIPSENLVYADRKGNIGWIAAGQAPIRKGWSGLFPVPGNKGSYEWSGYLPIEQNPSEYNPARHFLATANHDILPPNYPHVLSYSWAPPTRYRRIVEMLTTGHQRFDVTDFQRMQQDVQSLPAREFLTILQAWSPQEGSESETMRKQLLAWDCNVQTNSFPALLYEVWIEKIGVAMLPAQLSSDRLAPDIVLKELQARPNKAMILQATMQEALYTIRQRLGSDRSHWTWGQLHRIRFQHPLHEESFALRAVERPGDSYTVNATSGPHFAQSNGASYREVLDTSDWDRSVTTNVPGESGVPGSKHYSDLTKGWSDGDYHPLPYSRKAVEEATEERIVLVPAP